ncbi:hypothetical protein PINS_up022010 [Pythium insidiosum]|nr:hypothetical protein PINS_up022010 [Pythium insidiosum]
MDATQNSYGELGHGDVNDRATPTALRASFGTGYGAGGDAGGDANDDEALEVVDVACGNEQTALLSADGDVYACGYNDSGQCGTGTTVRVLRPTRVLALSSKKIVRLFAGNGSEHLAALTDSGRLYTFGFNCRGQLGHGTTTDVAVPKLVEALADRRVVDVACSYFHTAIVTEDGGLYTCGRNDFGQLGLSSGGHDRLVPTLVTALGDHHAQMVSCGQHHTVVSVANGGLFAFGKNDHGQLGVAPETATVVSTPTRVASPLSDNLQVVSLACGYYHTAVVTADGTVWTFGRNEYGQLGLGHKRHVAVPTPVDTLRRVRIIQVACGCYHTLTLSDDGKVYPFGRNNHGQLGLETAVDCAAPQVIPSLRGHFVRKVAAGFYHSVCLVGQHSQPAERSRGSLSWDLRRMLNNPCRSDVKFIVDGKVLYAHSCIIMARCEPLEKMLDGRTKDGSQDEIVIPECEYDVFAALMEFLYTDEVLALDHPGTELEFLLQLMALTDQYLVTALTRLCEAAILRRLNVENVCAILDMAHFRDAFKLKRRCMTFILDHFAEVIATEAFVGLPQELLQEVLQAASRSGVVIPNQQQHNNGFTTM